MKTIRRRRGEKKTDYKARFALLKSGRMRLIVRKTNRYIIVQIVETHHAQDKVCIGMTSKVLLEKGWPKSQQGSIKNLQAAYLTGYLLGKMAKEKKIFEAILDIGMQRNIHKSRLYAVLKGALDAGLHIPHEEKALPSSEDILKNEKLKTLVAKIMKE